MDAFIEGLNFNSTREASDESSLYLLRVSGAADMWNIEAYEASVETNNPRYISVIGYAEEDAGIMMKVVVYSPDAMTLESIELEKGWSEITFASSTRGRKKSDSDRLAKLKQHVYSVLHGVKLREGDEEYSVNVVKLNQLTTYTHEDIVGTVVSTDPQFASLNGTVFGSVEGEAPVVSTHTITTTVTNGTYSGDTEITDDDTATVTLSAYEHYNLPSEITVVGASYTYDSATGIVALSNPTENVTITAVCAVATFTITPTVTNGSASGDNSIDYGGTASVTISADAGYDLPSTVSVTGATASYDSTTGVISLSEPTGNVTISAECTQQTPTPSLTPFSVGQTIEGIQVDTTISVSDVVSVLSQLTYEGEQEQMANLLAVTDYIMMAMKQPNEQDGTMYAIVVVPRGGSEADMLPIFISETVPDFATEGWNNLTDGVVDVNIGAITAIEQSSVWNDGTIFGAVVAPAQNNDNK